MSIPHNILGVKIEGEFYAFDGDRVEQILRVPHITPVPLSDEAIIGVSSISGKIITVVDTGLILGGKQIDYKNPNARILTIDYQGATYGVLVDEVLVMTTLDRSNYEAVEKGNGKITGFYKQSDAIYQIIDESAAISTLSLLSFAPTTVDKIENKNSLSDDALLRSNLETQRYLFLKLGNESFAISLEITREIIFVPEKITPVKEAGFGVLGVIVLRGELITAIDLRKTLGFDTSKKARENRLLILNKDGKSLALLVDSIEEVKDVELNLVETLPNRFSDSKIEAIYKAKAGITSLVDKSYLVSMIEEYYIEDNDQMGSQKNEHSMDEDAVEIAVFKIATEEYALEIEDLQEIIKYTKETPVPEAPQFVDGIINLRGVVIPIFSLPERLGFAKNITTSTKILVCNINREKLGLLVDDVSEILFVNKSLISASDSSNSLFNGVITLNDGKRIILKIETENIITQKLTEEIKDALEDM
jgi:purine-binding chemotaxis protein CheW